jgi:hypothetical protein
MTSFKVRLTAAVCLFLFAADCCQAGLFRNRSRRCFSSGYVECAPAVIVDSKAKPDTPPAKPMPATLELVIPAGVKVMVDGKAAKAAGKETFVSAPLDTQKSHTFQVVVEYPATTKVPPLSIKYEVKGGAVRPIDLTKPVADWKKANEELKK